jgi:hypothetical protein
MVDEIERIVCYYEYAFVRIRKIDLIVKIPLVGGKNKHFTAYNASIDPR